jgi:hypothetical protein
MGHLTRELLIDFIECRLSRNDNMLVVRHMLSRCPDCIPLQRAVLSSNPSPLPLWAWAGKLGKVA